MLGCWFLSFWGLANISWSFEESKHAQPPVVTDERYVPPFQISKSLKLKWLQLTKRAAKKPPVWSHWVSASLILGVDHFEQTINPSKTSQWQIHLRVLQTCNLQRFPWSPASPFRSFLTVFPSFTSSAVVRATLQAGQAVGHHGTLSNQGPVLPHTKSTGSSNSAYKLVGEPNPFFTVLVY